MNPEMHKCPTCGFEWKHGQHGGHSCAQRLFIRVAELEGLECAVRILMEDPEDEIASDRVMRVLGKLARKEEADGRER